MNEDLRRLTIAAAEAHDAWFGEPASITPAGAEAIVRAVLIALREPSEEMQHAANAVEVDYGAYRAPIGYEAAEAFTAMIDHILAERKP